MEFEIALNEIQLYAYHGVYREERETGNVFIVSLSVYVPYNEELSNDNLEKTVSYADLYEIVRKQMSKPSNLLENVAIRIVKSIKETYPKVTKGKVRIEKKRPPIKEMIGSASVTLFF